MIMIIAIIYIFFILSDIWSTVENSFQKILSLPTVKKSTPFILTPSLQNSCKSPPFYQFWKFFIPHLLGMEDTILYLVRMVSFFPNLV